MRYVVARQPATAVRAASPSGVRGMKAALRGDTSHIARLAARLMRATLAHQALRATDYRRSELVQAEGAMIEARNRLFDALMYFPQSGGPEEAVPQPTDAGKEG